MDQAYNTDPRRPAPEGLVRQGDSQLLAVGVDHRAGELPGLGALFRRLLRPRLAEKGLGQLDGTLGAAVMVVGISAAVIPAPGSGVRCFGIADRAHTGRRLVQQQNSASQRCMPKRADLLLASEGERGVSPSKWDQEHPIWSEWNQAVRYVWMNGELVPFLHAQMPVMSSACRSGVNVFEGLRAYWNEEQRKLYVFRMREHYQRLIESMRIMHLSRPEGLAEMEALLLDTLRANGFQADVHVIHTVYLDAPARRRWARSACTSWPDRAAACTRSSPESPAV